MTVTINNNDVFIDLNGEISEKSIDYYDKKIEKAADKGCKKLVFNFEKVKNLDNIFVDFIVKLKEKITSISFYNVNMTLLPAFYLMKIDQVVSFYTSEYDAINEVKPIVKRRLGVVQRKILMFLTTILVLTNIA
jgi:hypothetical protein